MIETLMDDVPAYRNLTRQQVWDMRITEVLEDWYKYRLRKDSDRAVNREYEKMREENNG